MTAGAETRSRRPGAAPTGSAGPRRERRRRSGSPTPGAWKNSAAAPWAKEKRRGAVSLGGRPPAGDRKEPRITVDGVARAGKGRSTPAVSKRRRRRMGPAARRAVSQRMKAYWAKQKSGRSKVKGKAKGAGTK